MNFSGMVGELVHKDVELGASPLFMTVDRVPLIQYIAMPTPTGSAFVFRAPKLSYTDNVFLLPFNSLVWYCLLGLVLITTLLFTVSVRTEWTFNDSNVYTHATLTLCVVFLFGSMIFQKKLNEDQSILRPTMYDVSLLVFGATCQQGTAVTPRSMASRVIMVLAYTILMFLYTSYAANIVAMLQSPSTKIRTLSDLYHSRLQIGVDDTVFNRYYFSV